MNQTSETPSMTFGIACSVVLLVLGSQAVLLIGLYLALTHATSTVNELAAHNRELSRRQWVADRYDAKPDTAPAAVAAALSPKHTLEMLEAEQERVFLAEQRDREDLMIRSNGS